MISPNSYSDLTLDGSLASWRQNQSAEVFGVLRTKTVMAYVETNQ